MCITYALVVECLIFSWITTYLYKIDDHFSFRICIFIEHDVIAWKISTNLLKQKCEQLFFDLGFTVLMIYLWNCLPKYFRWQWPPLWLTVCAMGYFFSEILTMCVLMRYFWSHQKVGLVYRSVDFESSFSSVLDSSKKRTKKIWLVIS